MIKSLHVINGLGTGGAERSLAELLAELPRLGVTPQVAVLHARREGVEEAVRAQGLHVTTIESSRLPGRVAQLRRLIRERRIDVVHSSIAEANMVARFACAGTATPLLTSLVNTPYAAERIEAGGVAAWKVSLLRGVERLIARPTTAHFHAITQAVATHAVDHLGLERDAITVVPRGRRRDRLGATSAERRDAVRSALGIDPDTKLILNVGRREPQKGQVHLLHAVRSLRDGGLHVRCLIAGREGTSSQSLRRTVEQLHLGGDVDFLNHRDDVPDLQVAADVFAFPSMYEGLGGALLEAMALGTPIVASDVPAIREVLEDGRCGRLVPPGDPAALAESLRHTLTCDTTDAVDAAKRRFDEVYDHDLVVEQMAELLIRVAQGDARLGSGTTA